MSRIPPHDLESENAVLTTVLERPETLDTYATLLRPEHFYLPLNRVIFAACIAMAERGKPVDYAHLREWLRDRQRLTEDMVAHLTLVASGACRFDIQQNAERVRGKWLVRQMISACQRIAAEGYGDVGDAAAWLDKSAQALADLTSGSSGTEVYSLKEVIVDTFRKVEDAALRAQSGESTGFSTGFQDLDATTSGMHPGELWIVAGRPGMGKTAFAGSICTSAAYDDNRAEQIGSLIVSLEMPLDQIGMRLTCCEAGVDVNAVRNGHVNWDAMTYAARRLSALPIWCMESVDGLLDLQAQVRKVQAACAKSAGHGGKKRRLGVVAVDYLQLMPTEEAKGKSREQEVAELSKGLKRMAKKLGVCVIALAQLSRKVEERADKRPLLSDLRESGSLEQDADVVLFLYRDEYYDQESKAKGIAECIIAKQRNGPTKRIPIGFDAARTRFYNLDSSQQQAAE